LYTLAPRVLKPPPPGLFNIARSLSFRQCRLGEGGLALFTTLVDNEKDEGDDDRYEDQRAIVSGTGAAAWTVRQSGWNKKIDHFVDEYERQNQEIRERL